MKHRMKNTKFMSGQDSNEMMMRKLMTNFLRNAHLTTSEKRGKAVKSQLDRVIAKAREKTESNKNYLLRYFPDKKIINALFDQVGPAVKNINGGYVKLVRLNKRLSDATQMVEVQWAHPVVIEWEKPETSESKSSKDRKSADQKAASAKASASQRKKEAKASDK